VALRTAGHRRSGSGLRGHDLARRGSRAETQGTLSSRGEDLAPETRRTLGSRTRGSRAETQRTALDLIRFRGQVSCVGITHRPANLFRRRWHPGLCRGGHGDLRHTERPA
jgi:hypothetical protein